MLHPTRRALLAWLLVAAWLSLILVGSGDGLSFSRSSRFLRPLIEWLFPSLPEEQMWRLVLAARKLAHGLEFGVTALLAWRAWRLTCVARGVTASAGRLLQLALVVAVAGAALDEFRQTFTRTREGCVRDVLIDASGAVVALLALHLVMRWRQFRAARRNLREPGR